MFKKMFIIVITFFVLTGCGKEVVKKEIGDSSSKNKILIATEDSQFKNMIADNLVSKLNGSYIKIIDVRNLSSENPDGFNAIAIVSTVKAGQIHKKALELIGKPEFKSKIILLSTYGTEKNDPSIDTISSSSKLNKIPELAGKIFAKIEPLLIKE